MFEGILVACVVITSLGAMYWSKQACDAKDAQIKLLERLSSPRVLDWLTQTKEIAEKRWKEVQEENEKQKTEIEHLKAVIENSKNQIKQLKAEGQGMVVITLDNLDEQLQASTASIVDLSASNMVTGELIQKATREMAQTFGDWLKLTAEEIESNQRMKERVIEFLQEHNGEHEYETLYVFFDRERTGQIQTVLQDMIANKQAVVENGIFKLTSFKK